MSRTAHPVCVSLVALAFAVGGRAADPADPQSAVTATLAIQDAMRQGRECLQRGQAKAAVELLETQLTRINGNPAYLGLLREAYAAYVKELQLANQDELCEVYQKRLQILDKSPAAAAIQSKPAAVIPAAVGKSDDDPLQQTPRRGPVAAHGPLPEAETAFAEKRYAEADGLFGQAFATESADAPHARQWAYCKLYTVVARLKEAEANHTPIAAGETGPRSRGRNEVGRRRRQARNVWQTSARRCPPACRGSAADDHRQTSGTRR